MASSSRAWWSTRARSLETDFLVVVVGCKRLSVSRCRVSVRNRDDSERAPNDSAEPSRHNSSAVTSYQTAQQSLIQPVYQHTALHRGIVGQVHARNRERAYSLSSSSLVSSPGSSTQLVQDTAAASLPLTYRQISSSLVSPASFAQPARGPSPSSLLVDQAYSSQVSTGSYSRAPVSSS